MCYVIDKLLQLNYLVTRLVLLQIQNYGIGGQYEPHCDHARVSKTLCYFPVYSRQVGYLTGGVNSSCHVCTLYIMSVGCYIDIDQPLTN